MCKMFLVRKLRWVPLGNSRKCQESRKKECDTILEQERQSTFDEFWLIMSWDLKNLFACGTGDIESTERKSDGMRQRKSSLFPVSALRDQQ
ncbi:hypothetical protein AVEN_50910-1 [Araneus ventricosus]|uniref:Uncharacterized protein n=1 Tax=Araneus ventricosus TaxID=182803 RepID=A0A4Y2DYP6_ARAVE|nr:hypothetical protein AVEN_50910-1 [Araneus ventricosus]